MGHSLLKQITREEANYKEDSKEGGVAEGRGFLEGKELKSNG